MSLLRLAVPLVGLFIAAPQIAVAASITVDIPSCTQLAVTGSGPSYAINCTQAAMICVAQSAPVSPSGGTQAALTVACNPAATAVTWTASRDCTTPTPGVVGQATVTEAVGGRSCVYTASATAPGTSGLALAAVVWQGASTAVPPSGCTVTRTPASGSLGSSGGAISMSGSCSGGGTVTSWSWRKNATPGWSSAQAPTDSLPANAGTSLVTYTYGLTACASGACAAEVVTTFTVAGATPVGFCGQFTDVRSLALNWGSPPVQTYGGIGLVPGTVILGSLAVPAGATSPGDLAGVMSIVEHLGPTAERVMTVSTQPCDFRGWTPGVNFPAGDPTGVNGPLAWGGGINPQVYFLLAGDPPGFPPKARLTPGQTYYINLQTIRFNDGANSCGSSSCDVLITVNPPT